jgi:HSP20 family protein
VGADAAHGRGDDAAYRWRRRRTNRCPEDGLLAIAGERQEERKENDQGLVRNELVYGRFYRAIPLPDGADENRVTATFRNGVLEITVPVAEREQGRRVRVQS